MKSERNIFIAFILNLSFSFFEFLGGILTGSTAILSDAVHDLGDAASIGISFFLEKKSRQQPDESYTYGYARYSVLGSVITTVVLLLGSAFAVFNAVKAIIIPNDINYNGMILLAIIGLFVNFAAACITHKGETMNQRAVNLHMLEDVLGWAVVLVGALIMRFTNITVIDPIMSLAISVFIIVNATKNLCEAISLFLEKTPNDIDIKQIKKALTDLPDVLDVHHIHVWSIDGTKNYATLHIVTQGDAHAVKAAVRRELERHNISHSTLELEAHGEPCHAKGCRTESSGKHSHHHH